MTLVIRLVPILRPIIPYSHLTSIALSSSTPTLASEDPPSTLLIKFRSCPTLVSFPVSRSTSLPFLDCPSSPHTLLAKIATTVDSRSGANRQSVVSILPSARVASAIDIVACFASPPVLKEVRLLLLPQFPEPGYRSLEVA